MHAALAVNRNAAVFLTFPPPPKQSQESCYGMHRVWAPLWAQRTQGGLILQQLWGASQSKLGYSTITLLLGAFGHFQPRCSL